MKNIKILRNIFNNLDSIDLYIMKLGLRFSFIVLIISIFILLSYLLVKRSFLLFNLGFTIFKLSTYLLVEFIICGLVMDKIKNDNFS